MTRYDWEEALKYADSANNRLLNKARELITFNGLTLAVFGTLTRLQNPDATDNHWTQAGIVLALASAVILLWTHFLVDFGPRLSDYADPKTEFDSYVVQVVMRGKWITVTGFLSFLSLIPLLVIVFRVL